jgi:hypothetical protein
VIELGKKSEIFGADKLVPLQMYGKPERMPKLITGHKLICGYDQGLGERLFVCESLVEAQQLYDSYYNGGAIRINWYSGEDPGFIHTVKGQSNG